MQRAVHVGGVGLGPGQAETVEGRGVEDVSDGRQTRVVGRAEPQPWTGDVGVDREQPAIVRAVFTEPLAEFAVAARAASDGGGDCEAGGEEFEDEPAADEAGGAEDEGAGGACGVLGMGLLADGMCVGTFQ